MVNIMDYKDLKIEVPEKILPELFEKQRKLISKYGKIEKVDHLLDREMKMKSLQDPESQWYCKDMAWRVTEEIAEMAEAIFDESEEYEHRFEEIADIIHFAIELMILSGFDASDFEGIEKDFKRKPDREYAFDAEGFKDACFWAVYWLGISMNKLKSKPWKTSQVISDLDIYNERLKKFFYHLFYIPMSVGVMLDDVYKYYYKKNLANNFRLESGY